MTILSVFIREVESHEVVRFLWQLGSVRGRDGILENLQAARRSHRRGMYIVFSTPKTELRAHMTREYGSLEESNGDCDCE